MNATQGPNSSQNLKDISSKGKYSCYILTLIYRLAEELIAKETISLPDIVKILGDRPYPMKESVREYLEEMIDRQKKEEEKKKQEDSSQ